MIIVPPRRCGSLPVAPIGPPGVDEFRIVEGGPNSWADRHKLVMLKEERWELDYEIYLARLHCDNFDGVVGVRTEPFSWDPIGLSPWTCYRSESIHWELARMSCAGEKVKQRSA